MRNWKRWGVCFASIWMLGASTARAAEEGDAVVVLLEDGSTVRGRLAEVVPGDHVSVKLEDGSTGRIAWRSITRIAEPHEVPPPAKAPVPSADPPEIAKPQRGAEGVFVTIRSAKVVQLERSEHYREWKDVCVSPCEMWLPTSGNYRIRANGSVVEQLTFSPAQAGTHVVLHVTTRSTALLALGVVATSIGGLMALGSLAAREDWDRDSTGPTVGLLGVVLLGTGILMLATNHSSVRSARDSRALEPIAALRSLPKAAPNHSGSTAFSIPLVSFRF